MSGSGTTFTTVTFDDGTFAVVKTDPKKPRVFEVVAIFYDASRSRSYAEMENARFGEPAVASTEAPTRRAEPTEAMSELSPRQSAVLEALRTKMNDNNLVEAKAAALAEAAAIPLGSLHSVLQSLEKKQLIKAARAGSPRAPAVYEVL